MANNTVFVSFGTLERFIRAAGGVGVLYLSPIFERVPSAAHPALTSERGAIRLACLQVDALTSLAAVHYWQFSTGGASAWDTQKMQEMERRTDLLYRMIRGVLLLANFRVERALVSFPKDLIVSFGKIETAIDWEHFKEMEKREILDELAREAQANGEY